MDVMTPAETLYSRLERIATDLAANHSAWGGLAGFRFKADYERYKDVDESPLLDDRMFYIQASAGVWSRSKLAALFEPVEGEQDLRPAVLRGSWVPAFKFSVQPYDESRTNYGILCTSLAPSLLSYSVEAAIRRLQVEPFSNVVLPKQGQKTFLFKHANLAREPEKVSA